MNFVSKNLFQLLFSGLNCISMHKNTQHSLWHMCQKLGWRFFSEGCFTKQNTCKWLLSKWDNPLWHCWMCFASFSLTDKVTPHSSPAWQPFLCAHLWSCQPKLHCSWLLFCQLLLAPFSTGKQHFWRIPEIPLMHQSWKIFGVLDFDLWISETEEMCWDSNLSVLKKTWFLKCPNIFSPTMKHNFLFVFCLVSTFSSNKTTVLTDLLRLNATKSAMPLSVVLKSLWNCVCFSY